jgi:hypothetical protein
MARIDQGDSLSSAILQPGWKTSADGYGLITITATYKTDNNGDFDPCVRGTAFPDAGYSYCKSHKNSISWDTLGIATITVDYVGIDPDINGGDYTNPQVSASNGLTSENISTNPNFFVTGGDGYGDVIAGPPTFETSKLGPTVTYIDDAGVKRSRDSFVGQHGACFETPEGGRFIGFVDPTDKHFYGKTNYLSPVTSFSGHFYTTSSSDVQHMIRFLGTSSRDNDWAGTMPDIVPTYAGGTFVSSTADGEYNQLLLSQVNIEDYGLLYKVNYEVRYSVQGWPDEVYRDSRLMP